MIVACDTNIILYSIDVREQPKRVAAMQLIRMLRARPYQLFLPWQVAGETLSQLRRWAQRGYIQPGDPRRFLCQLCALSDLVLPSEPILTLACDVFESHSLSHWDSMLVAACLEAGVERLYTEDMGAPRQIESLDLVNPFTQ